MRIGIQISSDLKKRTGVGEYIYQLLKYLPEVDDYKNHQFFIYTPKTLKWPFKKGWTQIRLSWGMLKNRLDILFVPAHTFPLIHPKLVVAIQGLEFERVPECYSFWQKKKLRFLTKRNVKKATKIIVPSKCTKNDLIKFYKVASNKIQVIPHGIMCEAQPHTSKLRLYLLYLGTKHKRKNIDGLKKAFKILKEKYKIPHKLILAGPNGRGRTSHIKNDIIFTDFVDNNKKWELLKNADIFVSLSFYEGFGFPVLEAQAAGVPVVASNISSLPEILGNSALLVNPRKPEEIAEVIYKIIKNPYLREKLIKKGYENVKRFNWKECAKKTLELIICNS